MRTFQTPAPIAAKVELGCGDLKIAASDRTDCAVTVLPRDDQKTADIEMAANALIELANGVLVVRVVRSWRRFTGPSKNYGSVIVKVELPSGSAVSAATGMGSIHCEGELADTSIKSGMGDIRLDRVRTLTAKTGLGDIAVDFVGGNANVATGRGEVRIGVVSGSTTVKNSSGTIEIAECASSTRIRSANRRHHDQSRGRRLATVPDSNRSTIVR